MTKMPEGFHTITPYIVVSDAAAAIACYEKALGAELGIKMMLPGTDKIMHACLQIGSSKIFLADENPAMGMMAPKGMGDGASFYLYVDDIDSQHTRALKAGMTEKSKPVDMFWGDRNSVVSDRFGHKWTLSTKVRNVSEAEMAEAMKQMAG